MPPIFESAATFAPAFGGRFVQRIHIHAPCTQAPRSEETRITPKIGVDEKLRLIPVIDSKAEETTKNDPAASHRGQGCCALLLAARSPESDLICRGTRNFGWLKYTIDHHKMSMSTFAGIDNSMTTPRESGGSKPIAAEFMMELPNVVESPITQITDIALTCARERISSPLPIPFFIRATRIATRRGLNHRRTVS